jgi:methyl-accepting chemotaxis protein
VYERIANATRIAGDISRGDLSDGPALKKVGKRCEADELIPAFVTMIDAIQGMIDDAGTLATAAVEGRLAERSQLAAEEISQLATGSVDLAQKAGSLLEVIVPSIQKTSNLVQEISATSSEQASGVAQINGAVGQISEATQRNAAASEELASTAEEMNAQVETLQAMMDFFAIAGEAQAPRGKALPNRLASTPPARSGLSQRPRLTDSADGAFTRF